MFPVRGKRLRREKPSLDTNSRSRGRPRKPHDQLASTKKALLQQYVLEAQIQAQAQAQSRSNSQAVHQLSRLESLPVELIHAIFFYALEINLPRASQRLCQVLSAPSIYKALTLLAYFDDDGEQPVETRWFLPARYRVISVEEKIVLQTAILSCRWCSYEFVRAQLGTLRRLVSRQAWHRWRAIQARRTGQATDHLALRDLESDESVEAQFFAGELSCLRDLPTKEPPSEHGTTQNTMWTIFAARVITGHLLRGPWTNDGVRMIRLLHGGYSCLSYGKNMYVSASAVFEGMAAAIEQAHIEALAMLLQIYKDFLLDDSSRPRYCMPVTLFHLATRQKESGPLLRLLIDAAAHDVPKDDDRLTSWALRESSQVDQDNASIAIWLLDWMRGTSNGGIQGPPVL